MTDATELDEITRLRAALDEAEERAAAWDEIDRLSHVTLLRERDEARAEVDKWKSVSAATLEANKVLLKTICRADREREAAEATLATVRAEHTRDRERLAKVEAAIDRVRRRHPRGDEEPGPLAPGLWCPTCGRERGANGYGACPERAALATTSEEAPDA